MYVYCSITLSWRIKNHGWFNYSSRFCFVNVPWLDPSLGILDSAELNSVLEEVSSLLITCACLDTPEAVGWLSVIWRLPGFFDFCISGLKESWGVTCSLTLSSGGGGAAGRICTRFRLTLPFEVLITYDLEAGLLVTWPYCHGLDHLWGHGLQ